VRIGSIVDVMPGSMTVSGTGATGERGRPMQDPG
jgi:hypothetical protein